MTNAKIIVSAQDQASSVISRVSGSLGGLQSVATKIGGALGIMGVAGVGALVSMAKSAIDSIDALNDLSDATGASVENISAIEDIARRTGTSMDTVTTAMVKFNGVLKDVKPGTGADQVLKELGLDFKKLRDLDPAEALMQTAVAFGQFADDGNKGRYMLELFGKNTKVVAALLKDMAEKGKLVPTVTTEMAKEAEKFNQELFAMKKGFEDLERVIAGPLVKAFNLFIEKQRQAKAEGKMGMFTSLEDMAKAADRKRSANLEGNWYEGNAGRGTVNPAVVKPSLGNITDPVKGGVKSGMSDAEKAAEEEKKFRIKVGREWAMEQGDAVNAENQRIHDERMKQEKEEVEFRIKVGREWATEEGDRINARNQAEQDALDARIKAQQDADDKFAETLHNDLKGAFSAAFRDSSGEPLQAFGDAIANVLYTRAATALAESLIGAAGGTGGGSLLSTLFSFDGGGYTGSGARSGGVDGRGGFMAIMHPDETVTDHTKGQSAPGGQPITVIQNFTVGDVASVSMVQKAVAGSERRIAGAMGRSMQYGGALA